MRRGRPALGRVDDASARLVLESVEREILNYRGLAAEHWRALAGRRASPHLYTYELMNAMGYEYGALLAGTVLDELRAALGRAGAEGLAEAAERAVRDLGSLYAEVESRRQTRSTAVVSRAFRELEPAIPEWVDPAAEIREAVETPAWGGRAVYYNDFHYDVMEALAAVGRRLEAFLANHALPRDVVYRVPFELPLRYEAVPAGLEALSEGDERALMREALGLANEEIRKRIWYGLRTETLPDQPFFTALFWSNGAASWFVDPSLTESLLVARHRGVRQATLDANYILVLAPWILMEKVASVLDPHPLYALSFEGKARGEYPEPTDVNVVAVIRAAVDAANPGMEADERAALTAQWFRAFRDAKAGDEGARFLVGQFIKIYRVHAGFARLFEAWFANR